MMSFQVKFLNEAITVELQQFGDVSGKIPLTLSVPVNYQQPTSPYITHTKYDI